MADIKKVHRDDLSPEMLAELEAAFPGKRIRCAGDWPEGTAPPEIQQAFEALVARHRQSLAEGTCLDCGAKMPGFPPEDWDTWRPPAGWAWFEDSHGEPTAWQCPTCDRRDGEGPRFVEVELPS